MQKKLLILGAGVYQVPLILKAKEMGLYTIAASYAGPYPGLAIADEVWEIDTTDYHHLLQKAQPDRPGRYAAHNRIWGHILCHHCSGADDGAVPNGNSCHDDCLIANPYIIANDNIALIIPCLGNIRPVQSPFFKEQGKWIGGKGAHGMVCTVKQEPGATGNGTKFSYDKPVMVDGVMVQHVVLFE